MILSTLTGPPAPSPPGGSAALFASGYKEEQAGKQER